MTPWSCKYAFVLTEVDQESSYTWMITAAACSHSLKRPFGVKNPRILRQAICMSVSLHLTFSRTASILLFTPRWTMKGRKDKLIKPSSISDHEL